MNFLWDLFPYSGIYSTFKTEFFNCLIFLTAKIFILLTTKTNFKMWILFELIIIERKYLNACIKKVSEKYTPKTS